MIRLNKLKTSILALLTFTSININAETEDILQNKITPIFSEKKININKVSEKSNNKFSISLFLNDNMYILELEDNIKLNKRKKYSNNSFTLLKGKIKNIENSWVRLTENNGLYTGVVFDGSETFVIDSVEKFNDIDNKNNKLSKKIKNEQIIAMNLKDIKHDSAICPYHSNESFDHLYSFDNMSVAEDLSTESLTEYRTIVVNLTGDKEFVGNNETRAEENILSYVNTVNGLFESTFNITIEIGEMNFLNETNNLVSKEPYDFLEEFRLREIPIETTSHLFTGKSYTKKILGSAFIFRVCSDFGVGFSKRYTTLTPFIFAHELGHLFGSPHDNEENSTCAHEPEGYIMNPSLSYGLTEFSQCSQDKINSIVKGKQCFTVYNQETEITSIPNQRTRAYKSYQYDEDYTVDFNGENVFFELEVAPVGMTISEKGRIEWTPNKSQIGYNTVQILASGNNGIDRQYLNIFVDNPVIDLEPLYLNAYTFNSFLTQDKSGLYSLNNTKPYEVSLFANTWKYINHNVEVTPNTYLEFTFKSGTNKGEIQGIGLHKTGEVFNTDKFNIYGNDNWGITNFRYSDIYREQSFRIRLIDFYNQGTYDQIVFINDNDIDPSEDKYSTFSNIRIYEENFELPPLSDYILFNKQSLYPLFNQDGKGEVFVVKNTNPDGSFSNYGKEIQLTGNKWQIQKGNFQITSNSVLEFEFASNLEGDIHGIGFTNGELDSSHTFNVFGNHIMIQII